MWQILQVSGVGPAETLKVHNVQVVKDLPGVGAHLVDHPVVSARLPNKAAPMYLKPKTVWDLVLLSKTALQFLIFHTGLLTTNVRNIELIHWCTVIDMAFSGERRQRL